MDITTSYARFLSLLGLTILAGVAAWQFYLFAVFRGADGAVDVRGGTIHLGMAVSVGLITCVGAFCLISSFRRYDRQDEIHITLQGPPFE